MIFVTVGSQMPFDRLVKAVDAWACEHPGELVEAQIGNTDYVPRCMTYANTLTPTRFSESLAAASLIVAHAGMGTIISTLEFGKPMILLPRRGSLRETRNDHQVATANWLATKPGISVANSEADIAQLISSVLACKTETLPMGAAPEAMIAVLRKIIEAL